MSSIEPNMGLVLTTLRSELELKSKVRHLTDSATQVTLGFIFMAEYYSSVCVCVCVCVCMCVYTTFSLPIHLLMDTCSHNLAIVNNAIVNIGG